VEHRLHKQPQVGSCQSCEDQGNAGNEKPYQGPK
jgi:hypothetical protein